MQRRLFLRSTWAIGLLLHGFFCSSILAAPSPSIEKPTIQVEVGTHAGPVRRIAADEQRDVAVTVSDDKTARVWRLGTRELLQTLRVPAGPGDQGRLYGVALHPLRSIVAVGGTSLERQPGVPHAEVFLFDLQTGRLAQRLDAGDGEIKRLAWSADGSLLIAGTAGATPAVLAFDATSGRRVLTHAMAGPVFGLSVARSGRVAATDYSGALDLFDAAAGAIKPVQRVDTGGRGPVSVALSPDARQAVVGYFSKQRPAVIDLASGRRERELEPPDRDLDTGALMTVAWSPDGSNLYAAGAAALPGKRYAMWRFDARNGTPRGRAELASDSILDLASLGNGRLLYTSFDASWGSVQGDTVDARVATAVADLRGAEGLRADAEGLVVAWSARGREDSTYRMDMTRRVVERGSAPGLQGAVTRKGIFGPSLQTTDEAGRLPFVMVGSNKVPLGDGELAIAASYVMNGDDALVGTSRALMRLAPDGRTLWRVLPGAEVNAVVSARRGQLVITALSDGSLRWWNARDGTLVLTLLPTQAGAWIAWTPQGYFDASAGADRLAGWLVARDGDGSAEFHSLGRFRDRFNRPDIVDRALQVLDPLVAIEQAAPGERVMQAAAPTGPATPPIPPATPPKPPSSASSSPKPAPPSKAVPPAPTLPPATPPAPSFEARHVPTLPPLLGPAANDTFISPPSLALLGMPPSRAADDTVTVRYTMRSALQMGPPGVMVRLNGRPASAQQLVLPSAYDGRAEGRIVVKVPPEGATVHVIAVTPFGISDPLTLPIPAKPAPPPGTVKVEPKAAPTPPDTRPRLFLLAVGVSEYDQPDYRLGLPAKDASDFADVMQQQAGKQYRSVEVRRLINGQATRQRTLEGLQWLANAAETGDVAMLFIAGHGVNVLNGEYYFIPVDGHRDRLAQTAVPERAIRDALARVRGQALFFVDTCHAGNVIGNPRSSARELSRMASELASAENGVVVFASSSGRQESEESASWGNGAFTKAVISGLRGQADLNKSGRVTFKGLDFYVSEEVRRLTSGRQTPVTITPIGVADFSLVRL